MRYLLLSIALYLFLTQTTPSFAQVLPIKPTRTISFTTDEGSYMDVDVSPDGKTLLFDLLGDLYTVPVTGGTATQLTRGMAINTRPAWSHDGTKIAYVSDYSGSLQLNVRDLSGKLHLVLGKTEDQLQLYNDPYPIWTADGNYINIENKVYGLAGGKLPAQSEISDPKNYSAIDQGPIYYSRDGKWEYTVEKGTRHVGQIGESPSILYRYDKINNTKTTIGTPLKNYKTGAISPDGNWFAYAADSSAKRCLLIRNLAGSTERILVASLSEHPLSTNTHFSFSPDSKNIYISYGGKIHRINAANGKDQIIPFTANVKADLGPLNYNTFRVTYDSIKVKYTRSANASPDGKHLVFSALNKIYIMDLPNGEPHILTPQQINQYQPTWSPDGKWIAYVSWCDTVGGFLWRVPATGGKPEQLVKAPAEYQRPAWSPDGKTIGLIKGDPDLGSGRGTATGQLEFVPLNGVPKSIFKDTVRLWMWNKLAFSPDGKKIIYGPDIDRGMTNNLGPLLVSKDINSNEKRVLAAGFTGNGDAALIDQKSISPDGRFIVYSMAEDMYLVPVCNSTTTTVIYQDKEKLSAIRFAPGMDPYWEQGGKVLSWSYANKFYRIDPDKIMEAAIKRKANGAADSTIVTVSVIPDQTVDLNILAPASYGQGIIALKDVRIITMQGNQVIERGTILINNGRFEAVGSNDEVHIPKEAKVINLQGKTIMPGFVDIHLHMASSADIFPQQSWMYLVNLAFGVTTARDPATHYGSFGYSELLADGQMIGPRLYNSGHYVAVFANGGDVPRVDNLDDARSIVEKRKLLGGTFMKQYLLPTRIQKQWLSIASKEAGLNMTNEGEYIIGREGLPLAMLKDGSSGIEHNPDEWGDVYKDVITLFARSGTYFTPTLQVAPTLQGKAWFDYKYWHNPNQKLMRFMPAENQKDIMNEQPDDTIHPAFLPAAIVDARIRKADGLVTLGSHGNNEGIGPHNELWALQAGGLTNMEALQAATIMGAQAIGIQQDVGSIEVGKIADLIVLNKNPLDDIHNSREIKYVMKDGILYDGDTLDELWPEFKKCPEWRLKSDSDKKLTN